MSDEKKNEFEKAGTEKQGSLMGEFFAMMKQNKKFWLLPIIIILLLFGLLIVLGGTSMAPFIYTLF